MRGLTTAATLWVVAAIGMASGAGYYTAAVTATASRSSALWPLRLGAYTLIERFRPEEQRITVTIAEGGPERTAAPRAIEAARRQRRGDFELTEERDRRVVTLEVEPISEELVAGSPLPDVNGARWGTGSPAVPRTERRQAARAGGAPPGWKIELLGADDYPPEDGDSYYENARAKAAFGRSKGDPAAWMLGEDSGIEVDGLDGRPGIESARFGGADPVGTLLAALQGVEDRRARYVAELVALTRSSRSSRLGDARHRR